jgi:hypothetical protein
MPVGVAFRKFGHKLYCLKYLGMPWLVFFTVSHESIDFTTKAAIEK